MSLPLTSYTESGSLTSNAGSTDFNRPYHYIEAMVRQYLDYSDIGDSFHPDSISAK
jgi:hypothetical protein